MDLCSAKNDLVVLTNLDRSSLLLFLVFGVPGFFCSRFSVFPCLARPGGPAAAESWSGGGPGRRSAQSGNSVVFPAPPYRAKVTAVPTEDCSDTNTAHR